MDGGAIRPPSRRKEHANGSKVATGCTRCLGLDGRAVAPPGRCPPGRDGEELDRRRPTGVLTNAEVAQEHAWHSFTYASNCSNALRIRTDHWQLMKYYKVVQWGQPGVHCFDNGWNSGVGTLHMDRFYPWDIGNWCNNSGQHLNVTIDSCQFANRPNGGALGVALRPATWHCHCP